MMHWSVVLSIVCWLDQAFGQWWIFSRVLTEQPKFEREEDMCYNFHLNDEQTGHCLQQPKLLFVVGKGTKEGLAECEYQFREKRWNCSSDGANKKLYKRHTPEAAFVNGISSSAVTYRISDECDSGKLNGCGCVKVDDTNHALQIKDPEKPFYWTSCKDHIQYGMRSSRIFLDPSKSELFVDKDKKSLKKLIIVHNNRAARKMMSKLSQEHRKCTCQGATGQCLIKTCYKWLPSVRTIGNELHRNYRQAVKVRLENHQRLVSDEPNRGLQKTDLVYTERLNYCETTSALGIPGTRDRLCLDIPPESGDDMRSCSILCCGRGFTPIQKKIREKCSCKFHWCCTVSCEWCDRVVTEHRCK